ncbi:MAG TPA: hypothetical protein VM841_13945, partial [Actinomycetota bacterium]|nr:hypothetical protein [Actinomycetota bacterium]
VVLSVLTILGGLRVWQNVWRAEALRGYVAALRTAQEPAVPHLTPGTRTYLDTSARDFADLKTPFVAFRTLAEVWEQDFKAAKDRVSDVVPPAELLPAHADLIQGLDMYAGVARLYHLASQQREIGAGLSGDARAAVEEKVQVTLQHAREWANRAAAVYSLGGAAIEALELEWLGEEPSRALPEEPRFLVPTTPPPEVTPAPAG